MAARPRVLMLLPPGVPFGADWARAARETAEVITVAVVPALSTGALDGSRHFGRVAGDPRAYELVQPRLRPDRILGSITERIRLRGLLGAVAVIEREHGPIDLVHSHYFPNARQLAELRRRTGIPYVHTEHSTRLTGRSPHRQKQVFEVTRRIATSVFEEAERVITVSSYLRDSLEEQGYPGRFTVIGNPIDVELFHPGGAARDDRRLRAITVGRLEIDKGLDVVFAGLAEAARRLDGLVLEVVGDGEDRAALAALADDLGVADRVTFSGRLARPAVAERLRSADLYVTASRMETFGVAVAEAMASGLPVVATAVGSLPEVIGDGCGAVVDADDPAALAAGIVAVASTLDAFDAPRIADSIRRRFSYAAVGARLGAVYDECLVRR